MAERQRYDAVVIGAGHNGLVAACYLVGAGLRVCVLERYHEVGGAAITEELTPGFRVSTGSYVLSLAPRKIFDDLGAWDEGIELLERNPRFFAPFPDGTSMTFWNDPERAKAEIARFSPRDAEAYDAYDDFIERAARAMDTFILRPAPSYEEVASAFEGAPEERPLFEMLYQGSAADIAEHFFENERWQAVVAASGIIGTFRGPRDAGTGYVKLYHSMGMVTGRRGAWAYVRGAMGAVTQALAKVARKRGVEIRTSAEVAEILVDGTGRATGVTLTSGEEVRAGVVLSNADPKRTYLKLAPGSAVPADYRAKIEAIQIESPVVKINLALSELPHFTALEGQDQRQGTSGGLFIAPSIDYMQTACEEARAGQPATHPFMNIHLQSAVDDTVAPPGQHAISIFSQYFPYTLADGTWDERREEIGDRIVEEFGQYAPNVPGAVIARQVLGPPDLENRFGLTGGHIFQGELVPEQGFDQRPVPGSTSYEGPIGGLFLCGAGAWPGGCVMGAPGHNAAHEVIARFNDIGGVA
ncbi:MAG: NAD(P)/FAD-dependent oxidoreductase [Chloroflexota bacterium]|nr:NAD(P)/FAD-dependent oxidoreductase [Chloroflexota bacterium]